MVQRRTGKIGLRNFLYERKVPWVRDARCWCRRGGETVRYVFTECTRFKEMKRTMWAREVRKARLSRTTPAYVKIAVILNAENSPPRAISRLKLERPYAELRCSESKQSIKNRNQRFRTEATPEVKVPEEYMWE